jgi:ketosteroid isomerase-like protein
VSDVIERFIDCLSAQDWDGFSATMAEDMERVGPYGDLISPRGKYVAFLQSVVTKHPNYGLAVRRVTRSSDGRVAVAEVTETLTVAGAPVSYPEVLVFDVGNAGLITRVTVYTMRPDPAPRPGSAVGFTAAGASVAG